MEPKDLKALVAAILFTAHENPPRDIEQAVLWAEALISEIEHRPIRGLDPIPGLEDDGFRQTIPQTHMTHHNL